MASFKLPKKCRLFFRDITDNTKQPDNKLKLLFDGYYLCLLVGLSQAKINTQPDLEGELIDTYPGDYADSRELIAGLLLATEIERLGIALDNSEAIEELMGALLDAHSPTRLTDEGVSLLNQYAARGIDVMLDKMAGKHVLLEDFYEDYFECFSKGLFVE